MVEATQAEPITVAPSELAACFLAAYDAGERAGIAEGRRQMREEAAKLLEDANAKWQERVAVYRKAGNNGPYLGYGSVSAAEIRAIPIGDE